MEYAEKLKDPRWQKKRIYVFERDNWTCLVCKSKDKTLNIHHLVYIQNKEPWDIPDGLLITLCDDCHRDVPQGEFLWWLGKLVESILSDKDRYGDDFFSIMSNVCYSLKPE